MCTEAELFELLREKKSQREGLEHQCVYFMPGLHAVIWFCKLPLIQKMSFFWKGFDLLC